MRLNSKLVFFLAAVMFSTLMLPSKAAGSTLTLSTSNVTMTYSDVIFRPIPETGTTTFLDFTNGSNSALVEVKYEILDKTGVVIFSQIAPEAFLKYGSKARLTSTLYDSQFRKASEPLIISLIVTYLDAGAGRTTRRVAQVSAPFKFTERPISMPTPTITITATPSPVPTPTITITATPSSLLFENITLKSEIAKIKGDLGALNSKLKKICSYKPKPKGC